MTRFRSWFGPLLVLGILPAAHSTAQVRAEFGPIIGYCRPVGSFESTSASAVTLPAHPSDNAGAALGLEGRLWVGRRFGVELRAANEWSSVPASVPPGGPVGPTAAHVLTLAAQGIWALAVGPKARAWVGAGVGLMRHGGSANAPYGSPTNVAGTIGLGSSIRVHDPIRAVLGVTTYLYSLNVQSALGPTLERGCQVDPLVHLGMVWSWS